MKRYFCFVLTIIMMAVSCSKGTPSEYIYPADNQIRFSVLNLTGIDVHTKTVDPIEDLDSFYAAASTGTAGSETLGFSSATFTDPDGDGKYTGTPVWPNEPTDFNFYASNLPLTFTSDGMTVSAANGTDVVCAYSPDWAYKTECDMTFYHIFARLGNVRTVAVDDYTISGITINITPKIGGTYNVRTGNGYTNGTGWSSVTTASTVSSVANSTVGTKENDIYMVPGTYLMSVSWTATKGDYTRSFGPADVSVPMTGGKINDVVFRIGGEAEEILFSVTVSDWGVNPIDKGTLEAVQDVPVFSFGGFQIASGPMYYNGSTVEIKDNWNYDSYGSVKGLNAGSTYFTFEDLYSVFGEISVNSYYNVANIYDPLDGWRLPTQSELSSIYGTSRTGSTVNGSAGKHYALIKLTGVTHAGSSTPNGVLLFPDGETIIGKTLSGMDNSTQTTGVTLSELNAYLEQGCAFLPCSGWCSNSAGGEFGGGGVYTFYMSSEKNTGNNAYCVWISGSSFNPSDQEPSYWWTMVRLVKPIE